MVTRKERGWHATRSCTHEGYLNWQQRELMSREWRPIWGYDITDLTKTAFRWADPMPVCGVSTARQWFSAAGRPLRPRWSRP